VTFESIIRSRKAREAVISGPLGPYIDGFVAAASTVGYTRRSLYDLMLGASQFARYLSEAGVTDVRQIRDRHLRDFIGKLPVWKCCNGYSMPSVRGSRGARGLLRHLRMGGIIPPEPSSAHPYSWILEDWLTFLERHRGLAAKSLNLYRGHIEPFLLDLGQDATPDRFAALSATRVREYVQRQAPRFARSTRKNLVITLRSFLRFGFGAGYLQRDIANAIERVPCFALDRLPRGPRWEDLPKLLATVDRSTNLGRRDFAVLLLLMTYGVRAGQLTGLRLEDVHWRDAQITFPSAKRGHPINAPLTSAVGDALVQYLREGRPNSSARQLFLSSDPPFQPLAANSVYNVVSRAFRLSAIASPHRGGHAIRHAWATRALAQGQRLKTIADLLGHRSIESTRIYTKVDYTQLRSVGLPWPEEARS
jgi:integrase/recombinase XerD